MLPDDGPASPKLEPNTMRTQYLGDNYRDHTDGFKRTSRLDPRQVTLDAKPYADLRAGHQDDEMPVFDRASSGYREEYSRPDRDEDRVEVRRLKPWRRG